MEKNEALQVIIVDLLGREMLRQRIVSSHPQLDISSLHPGMYELIIPALMVQEKFEVAP